MTEETERLVAVTAEFNEAMKVNQRKLRPLPLRVTEGVYLGSLEQVQDAVNRTLTAVADIDAGLRLEVPLASVAEAEREKRLADFRSIDFGRPPGIDRLVKEQVERMQVIERRELAGQAAADMRLAAEAQVEKARIALADGVPAMEVAAVVAAAFTSLVEAQTYEQAAAHERTREHTRTNEGESHDEA